MRLSEIVEVLENIAPLEYALDSDSGRIGLVIDRGNNVNRAGVSLDPTDSVFEEALRLGVDLLITHHTLIFEPVLRISKLLGDTLKIALEGEISLYVMHTNFDAAPGGVNDVLSELLGLQDVEACGLARVGFVDSCDVEEFSAFVGEVLGTHVVWTGRGEVERVMVVGGSGFSREYMDLAVENQVDVLVSGELRHSSIRYAESVGLSLIDATHYATENPAMKKLCQRLPVESVFIEHDPQIRVFL
jgi:dinuclear metal center YbgI/SA1388 family protein